MTSRKWITKECVMCGKTFSTQRKRSKFCSLQCSGKHSSIKHPQNGPNNRNYKGSAKLTPYQAKMRWRARNPEKAKAHDIFRAALRSGEIERGPCEICGNEKVHGHHDDYSKPLEVRWLCHLHHNQANAKPRPHWMCDTPS